MNRYLVRTKDERTYVEPVLDYGEGPTLECWPMAIHVAESYGQAKSDFLWKQKQRLDSGVYSDNYLNLRCSLLDHDVPYPRGELTSSFGWDQYSNLIEL